MRRRGPASLATAAIALAGCGASHKPDQTRAAATCLRNALANQALGGSDNCADAIAAKVLGQGSGTRVTVTCTHRDANEYVCDVKVPSSNGIRLTSVQPGFYDVTYDGRSIVFHPGS